MLCQTSKNSQHGATRGKSNEIKSKLACFLEASESTRLRMGESLPNHHEDHIAGKADNSLQQKTWISYPDCQGAQVSAYTQVNMEDAPKLLKIPKSECPDIWIRLPRHKWPKSWSSMEDPVVPFERNLYGHPLAGLFWGKAI